jgi:hypothetical protein
MEMRIDSAKLKADLAKVTGAMDAIVETERTAGEGWVMTSMRRKLRSEQRRAVHGRVIAAMMRREGHDPFAYSSAVTGDVQESISVETSDALDDAYRTGRPQSSRMRHLFTGAAQHLAEWVRDNITSGRLRPGRTAPVWIRRINKQRAARGLVTLEWGNPPPYGVRSGRFVKGIRGIWNSGIRRPRRTVTA